MPGANTIDANVLVRQFTSQAPRKLRQSPLYDTIGKSTNTTAKSSRRTQKNDCAPALPRHAWGSSPRKVKDGMNMNRESVHPVFICNLVEATRHGPSGRVHENVKTTKLLNHFIDAMPACDWIGNVSFQGVKGATITFNGALNLRLLQCAGSRNGGDVCALAC